ncbi:MAG: hypothetical protein M1150_04315 [Patescibacteria group bacterium]|nr:hypothetical protein [Patescibacteria group bacterium]
MKIIFSLICFFGLMVIFSCPANAASGDIKSYATETLSLIVLISSLASVLFLIRGGYLYVTSAGNPEAIASAKKTIRNALLGLALVLAATVIQSIFSNALNTSSTATPTNQFSLSPIQPADTTGGLTKVLIDAIAGFLQNIIESATKPLVDGVIGFLTTTPSVASNSVIFNFWLVTLGIADSLFVLVLALLGLQLMSADTFGFQELEFKQILPRVGLAFLGANISIFLIDRIISLNNALIKTVLDATGGIEKAWVLNAFDPTSLASGATSLITLVFMILFVILVIVLMLFYISRMILIALGAALSPLLFLIWAIPKTADLAEIAVRGYLVTIFSIFIHVVIIQLASAFLTIPGQSGTNSVISILVSIGLFFTLLKTPSLMMQMVFYTSKNGAVKKIGGQILNVIGGGSQAGSKEAVVREAKG